MHCAISPPDDFITVPNSTTFSGISSAAGTGAASASGSSSFHMIQESTNANPPEIANRIVY